MAGMTEYKQILLSTLTPSAGQVLSTKLPSQMAWLGLQFRATGTFSGGGAGSRITQDADLNAISRIQLRANGRPIFELPVSHAFYRHNWMFRTAGARTAVPTGTGSGSYNWGFTVPFSLPYPSLFPQKHATIFPAGLINNIELLVTAPASFSNAIFDSGGTATTGVFSALSVSVLAIDMSSAELRKIISKAGHGYLQTHTQQNITGSGNVDLELTGGRGALLDLYCRVTNNSATSGTAVTNQRLLIGNNEFPVDSQHLELQDEAKRMYQVETVPGTASNTQVGATATAGSWMIPFNPDGQLNHGINLVGKPSFKLRNTWATGLTTPFIDVIQGIFDPHFYQTIL